MICTPVIFLGCTVVFIFAEPICVFVFGQEFAGTAGALRALMPVIALIFPSCLIEFPVLGAIGMIKHINYSVFIGAGVHIFNIILLVATGHLSMITLALSTSAAETIIFLYKLLIVIKNRRLIKEFANKIDEGGEK